MIRVESLILRTCERKPLSERDSCVRILEMRAEAHAWVNQRGLRSSNKILPRSAQILFVIGMAFVMRVNARSSNHEPNQEADRDPNGFRNVIRSFVNRPMKAHIFCPGTCVLPGACVLSFDTYFNPMPINHYYVFETFIPSKILSSSIISCNFS